MQAKQATHGFRPKVNPNLTDGIDQKEVTRDIQIAVNKLYGKIASLITFKYNLLIYRLVKSGYVKMEHLEEISGISRQRLHQIANSFEEKEVRRQNE